MNDPSYAFPTYIKSGMVNTKEINHCISRFILMPFNVYNCNGIQRI